MNQLSWERGTLVLRDCSDPPPGFVFDDRVKLWRAPASLYFQTVLAWHRAGTTFTDAARGWQPAELTHRTDKSPRDYQAEAIEAWCKAGRRGVVSLPTGSGKSFVAELAIAETQRPTLVIAPTIDLVNQWAANLERAFGEAIGVLGGGLHVVERITVSTYDSAFIHADRYGDRFGLVVFDEVHHLPADAYSQIAEMMLAPYRLGLSATVERPDGLHERLDRLVGEVCYEQGIKDLSGHVLADYEVRQVEVALSDDEAEAYAAARKVYRDFVISRGIRMGGPNGWNTFLREAARSERGRAALRAHREARAIAHGTESKLDAFEDILRDHVGERVIVFTNDNATVYRISRDFLVPCITHRTGADERRSILERFSDGTYRCVATSRVLNEGVDIPAAQVGIVLSGTSTVREHVQRLGRILRPQKGKQAVLYEVVTADTTEVGAAARRREHDAYR